MAAVISHQQQNGAGAAAGWSGTSSDNAAGSGVQLRAGKNSGFRDNNGFHAVALDENGTTNSSSGNSASINGYRPHDEVPLGKPEVHQRGVANGNADPEAGISAVGTRSRAAVAADAPKGSFGAVPRSVDSLHPAVSMHSVVPALQRAQQAADADALSQLEMVWDLTHAASGAARQRALRVHINTQQRRARLSGVLSSARMGVALQGAWRRAVILAFRIYAVALWLLFFGFRLFLEIAFHAQRMTSRLRFGRGRTLRGYTIGGGHHGAGSEAARFATASAPRGARKGVDGRPHVVIIGGGYVGTYAAVRLEHDFQVTLVEPNQYFEFTPSRLRSLVLPAEAGNIRVPMGTFLRNSVHVSDWVTGVDERQVLFREHSPIPFDYLMIATGGRTVPERFPSIDEFLAQQTGTFTESSAPQHVPLDMDVSASNSAAVDESRAEGFSQRAVHGDDAFVPIDLGSAAGAETSQENWRNSSYRGKQAVVLSARVEDIARAAADIAAASSIIIVGGGTVGVELIGELVEVFNSGQRANSGKLAKGEPTAPVAGQKHSGPKRITLVHSQDRLMQRSPDAAIARVEEFMARHDIEVIYGDRVEAQSGDEFLTRNGLRLQADVAIICTGNSPNTQFLTGSPFEGRRTQRGFIEVDAGMRLLGTTNVFVAGDISVVPGQEEKLCQTASAEASVCLRNLHAMENALPHEALEVEHCPILISLGRYDAILTYKGFVLTGVLPALMKEFVEWKELVYYWDLASFRRRKIL